MTKIDYNKIATEVFKMHSNVDECHITTDGTPFLIKNYAENHARVLTDRMIETVKNTVNKSATKEAAHLITTDQFQQAIDLKVLSYARGKGYSYGENNLGSSKVVAMEEIDSNNELATSILNDISSVAQRGTDQEKLDQEKLDQEKLDQEKLDQEKLDQEKLTIKIYKKLTKTDIANYPDHVKGFKVGDEVEVVEKDGKKEFVVGDNELFVAKPTEAPAEEKK